ncbi:MAG TPA: hypothetical protein ENF52_01980 [Chloroflexi bacterium]|nr:hypothetical protein [Chloroflexota bacterium]
MEPQSLKCAEVKDLLDMVVTDELAGVDVGVRYPAVMAHLQHCDRCRTIYTLLRDTLQPREETPLPPSAPVPPPNLSFLDTEEESPWRRIVQDPSLLFPLTFEIARNFIRRALCGPRLASVRGGLEAYGERRTLLLADWVTTEQGDWIVEVTAHRRADRPEVLELEARLVSDEPLPPGLHVALSWADQHLSAPVDNEGAARFHDLPLSHLIEPQSGAIKDDLTITFQPIAKA